MSRHNNYLNSSLESLCFNWVSVPHTQFIHVCNLTSLAINAPGCVAFCGVLCLLTMSQTSVTPAAPWKVYKYFFVFIEVILHEHVVDQIVGYFPLLNPPCTIARLPCYLSAFVRVRGVAISGIFQAYKHNTSRTEKFLDVNDKRIILVEKLNRRIQLTYLHLCCHPLQIMWWVIWEVSIVLFVHTSMQSVVCDKLHNCNLPNESSRDLN